MIMPETWSISNISRAELDLLVLATAAYQHHEKFRALHLKLCELQHVTQVFEPRPIRLKHSDNATPAG